MKIGFLGLGIMGSRMARNLLRHGHAVTVYNRNAVRAQPLLAEGATWAASPRQAAEAAEALGICVSDPAAMRAIADGPTGFLEGLAAGTLVIDFSTLSPATTRHIGDACHARGARFLESPVTGSKPAAEAGTLLLMCGGDRAVFDAAKPVLDAVGRRAIHVGAIGQASALKLAGNVIIAHMLEGFIEGSTLAARAGVSIEKLLEMVQASGYASPFWDFKGQALATRNFDTQFSVDLMHKDLGLALAEGAAHAVPMPGASAVRAVYEMARARGLGADDIAATARVIDHAIDRSRS